MTSSIADKTAESSSVSPTGQSNPSDHVVIVPPQVEHPSQNGGSDSAAQPPVIDESQATVLSKKPPESTSDDDFHPLLKQAVVTPAEMGAMLLGSKLGHFRLEEFVGGGGMGAVFRAKDTKLGRTVAVKILSKDRTDEDTLRRFENEAQSAARLDHTNIARVYYVGEDQGLHYIVFEFIEGINIRDLVRQRGGPLPVEEAISYVLQVAEALEHASLRNVIHRDIKPSNILVTADRRAKLVDMGLARLHQLESGGGDITASGVTLGTFDYISPEQARDPRVADVRSDLYSLGCTFYFMLTARPPFPEGTVLQKLLSHSTEEPTDPRMIRSDLNEQVVKVLDRLLAKQPSKRYQRPSELIGHLLLVAERLNFRTISKDGAVWVAPRQVFYEWLSKIVPWGLPILLFLVAAFAIGRGWAPPGQFEFDDPAITLQPPLPSPERDATPVAEIETPDTSIPSPIPKVETSPNTATADTPAEIPAVSEATVESAVLPATEAIGGTTADETPVEPPATSSASEPSAVPSETSATPEDAPSVTAGNENPATEDAQPSMTDSASSEPPMPTDADPVQLLPTANIDRIVVADEGDGITGALLVPTLAEACRDANQLGVLRIELHFDGPRRETPFEIASDELTICAGDGFSPQVVFRNVEPTGKSPVMISCKGKRLAWQGLDVSLEVEESSKDGIALFQIDSQDGFELRDSVLTIRNVDSAGAPIDEQAAFFSILPRTARESDAETPAVPRLVSLINSILRGQATIAYAQQAAPFRLLIDNSLIASRFRLVDVEGSAIKPVLKDGRIDLVVKHSTAALGAGLCRMTSDDQAPYQLDLHTEILDSIIFVTSEQAPIFERVGVVSLEGVGKHWDLRGRDNFYPGSTVLLRLRPTVDAEQQLDLNFESRDRIPFLEEKSPNYVLMWNGLPAADLTEDLHAAEHYELDSSDFNPGLRMGDGGWVGVAVESLPD